MLFLVPPRKEPSNEPSLNEPSKEPPPTKPSKPVTSGSAGGCLGAIVGASIVIIAEFVMVSGSAMGPGDPEDNNRTTTAFFLCFCGFPVGVGGLFGCLLERCINRAFGHERNDG